MIVQRFNMKYLISIMILSSSLGSHMIFDFNKASELNNWMIVDDVVMGGRSSGSFKVNADGHGVFAGDVSLENNGGFSSLRHDCDEIQVDGFTKIAIRLKGDGKKYQFRIKSNPRDYHSYISSFETSGEWEQIEIQLKDMFPSFRGRTLDIPNFADDSIEEIRFLIGNKKPQNFKLLIDKIELR